MKILILLRSTVSGIIFLVVTALLSASTILFSFFTTSVRIPRFHIKLWGRITCWLFGVKVVVTGKDNWKFEKGGVVLFNHTSFFDIFAMVGYLPDMRFGAKIELFSIPIFGYALRRVGMLPIDRERKEKVFAVYQQAVDRLSSGEKIALAPEGKRTSEPKILAPFKSGPFVFALQSQVDLIPVVIQGAYDVLPKNQILPNTSKMSATIHLTVLEPISIAGHTTETRYELQVMSKDRMQVVLDAGV